MIEVQKMVGIAWWVIGLAITKLYGQYDESFTLENLMAQLFDAGEVLRNIVYKPTTTRKAFIQSGLNA